MMLSHPDLPGRHLRHQLLHLGPQRLLAADEEHHQVGAGGCSRTGASRVQELIPLLFPGWRCWIKSRISSSSSASSSLWEALVRWEVPPFPPPSTRLGSSHGIEPFRSSFPPSLPAIPVGISIRCSARNPRLLLLHPSDKAGRGHGAGPQLLLGPYSGELLPHPSGSSRRSTKSSLTQSPGKRSHCIVPNAAAPVSQPPLPWECWIQQDPPLVDTRE